LPYSWNGNSYAAAGSYSVTLVSAAGCDSVATLNLTVNPVVSSSTDVTICNNLLPYSWNGNSYAAAGSYSVTLVSAAGCDSVATLNLTVNVVTYSTTDVSICANQLPYNWNGNNYNTAGNYFVTLQNAAGCDSITTLNLTINPLLTKTDNVSVCANQLPFIWNGNSYFTAGIYIDTLNASTGCDTIATLNLSINPLMTLTDYAVVCANQMPYMWKGKAYTQSGTYIDTLNAIAGCDTVATLILTVNPISTSVTNVTVCSNDLPYIWNGNSYNTAGAYNVILANTFECDSIATLNLSVTISPKLVINNPAPVCYPETVDLTAPAITAGSDAGLTFTYWKDAAATIPLLNPNTVSVSGLYYIKSNVINNCSSTEPVQVRVIIIAKIDGIRYPTISTTANIPVQLQARNLGFNFLWTPPVGLNFNNIIDPIFNYDKETEYNIRITTDSGCLIVDTLLIKIKPETGALVRSDIFVPKAWTPNHDGHNDKLYPLTVNIRELKYFRVFNRWGQLVFETNIIGQGWDGMYRGKEQVMDVYTWTVEAIGVDGKYYKRAGNSVLIR